MPDIIAVLVAQKAATLAELSTIYSYDDALDMLEIIVTSNYNAWLAATDRKKK